MNGWLIFIIVLTGIYTVLILWYRYGWGRLPFFEEERYRCTGRTKVSVIVPARNEEATIRGCLGALKAQTYPASLLEIIVVNDHSTDRTADVVRECMDINVQMVTLSEHLADDKPLNAYKKKAIDTAIGLSSGELILTTDADCIMGPKWVETVVKFYESHPVKFIAAPVAFYGEENFFEAFQSLDFMSMQGITGATAQLRSGTMCNGANLAYEKRAFYEVGAFQGIDCIASGDDMLLMYKMFKAYPDGIGFLKSRAAIVRTLPVKTLRSFMHQRIRWASKAGKYDDKRLTAVLAFVYLWNVTLLAFFLAGFFMPVLWLWWLGFIVYKTLIELLFLAPVARFFHKGPMLWQFFPSQFLHIPYIVISGWLGRFGSYQWKERSVK